MDPLSKKKFIPEYNEEFQKQYTILCQFLQSYKEKLLLTKKIHDVLDDEIITLEHLKKAKEGYTDQFSLDFTELMKGFI